MPKRKAHSKGGMLPNNRRNVRPILNPAGVAIPNGVFHISQVQNLVTPAQLGLFHEQHGVHNFYPINTVTHFIQQLHLH